MKNELNKYRTEFLVLRRQYHNFLVNQIIEEVLPKKIYR